MVNKTQIIDAAVEWLDTPYHHHAMVKGVGVDCAMLIVASAIASGAVASEIVPSIVNYPVQWHLHNREERLIEQLESFGCVRKDNSLVQPGDIIGFQFGRTTSHVGIMINETQFIHARWDHKKVVINTLNDEWTKRWTSTFDFPGVNNG